MVQPLIHRVSCINVMSNRLDNNLSVTRSLPAADCNLIIKSQKGQSVGNPTWIRRLDCDHPPTQQSPVLLEND